MGARQAQCGNTALHEPTSMLSACCTESAKWPGLGRACWLPRKGAPLGPKLNYVGPNLSGAIWSQVEAMLCTGRFKPGPTWFNLELFGGSFAPSWPNVDITWGTLLNAQLCRCQQKRESTSETCSLTISHWAGHVGHVELIWSSTWSK